MWTRIPLMASSSSSICICRCCGELSRSAMPKTATTVEQNANRPKRGSLERVKNERFIHCMRRSYTQETTLIMGKIIISPSLTSSVIYLSRLLRSAHYTPYQSAHGVHAYVWVLSGFMWNMRWSAEVLLPFGTADCESTPQLNC